MATPANAVGEVGGTGGGNVKDGEEPSVVGAQPEAVGGGQGQQGPEENENEDTEMAPGREMSAEELHLLTIFPEEVWLRIFDNLREEPQTLLNCMEASPLFRRLLKPTQPTWLFGKIFPHVVDYLTRNQILACRRTGRGWSKSMDNYYNEHHQLRPFNEATYRAADIGDDDGSEIFSRMYGDGPPCYGFVGTDRLINFMKSMGGSLGGNPFIDRYVCIYGYFGRRDEDAPAFWSTVFGFLDEFGKHIWYFRLAVRLHCHDARDANGRLLYLVRGCLSRLPNLRRFHLCRTNETVFLDPLIAPGFRDNLENVEGEELSAYLQRRPLPMIPSLESLYLDLKPERGAPGPVTICEHLLALHQNQLKMLKFDQLNVLTMEGGLPMLTEFHWMLQSANVDQIENALVRLNSPPLGKLILRIHAQEDNIDLGRLFGLISTNFGNTLRMLELNIWLGPLVMRMNRYRRHAGRLEVNATARLGMPHLEALNLVGNCFQQLRIDFLLDVASSLKYLRLRDMEGAQRGELGQPEELDIYEYMLDGRLYESNIWTRLPKLKRLYVRFPVDFEDDFSRFYCRDTYEFLKRGGQLAK